MDIYKEYSIDEQKSTEGVWMNLKTKQPIVNSSELDEDGCVLLAPTSASNSAFRNLYNKKLNKLKRGFRSIDHIPLDIQDRATAETMAETIVLNWKNFKDREGKDIPYSRDMATKLLVSIPELRIELTELSTELEFYRQEEEDQDIKNSPTS